jgi:hypothetical protein
MLLKWNWKKYICEREVYHANDDRDQWFNCEEGRETIDQKKVDRILTYRATISFLRKTS